MAVIASGVNKRLVFKKQTAQGTKASATGGQSLRRVTSDLDMKKATYASNEIQTSQQVSDFRHGVISVDGTISGEVSVGTYQSFTESILRQNALPSLALSALTVVEAIADATVGFGTLKRTGSWLTSGLKIGMVIRCSGFLTTGLPNNNANMLIIGMTATDLKVARLDGKAVVAKVAGDSVIISVVGKFSYVPEADHTRDYYTIEHFFADVGESEQFVDCVIGQMSIGLPASGMATCEFTTMGLKMDTSQTAYFTSPLPTSTGKSLAAANGIVILDGKPVGLITGMDFNVNGNQTTIGGVVGSNIEPDVFPGKVTVDGNATVLFQNNEVRDLFINEIEVSLVAVFTTGSESDAGFISYTFPRIKMGGATKDDGEKGLVMTMPFTALQAVGGANDPSFATTVMIQDSAWV